MNQNKNLFPQNPIEFNIFRNDRPQRRAKPVNQLNKDIISHLSNRHHSTMLQNPQKQTLQLSYSKHVPPNDSVLRDRSQMIVHASKVSKDVPSWFKGNTYKYYSRNQYNNLYKANDLYTIDTPTTQLARAHYQNRSQAATPRSRQSEQSDNFYLGGGTRQPSIRKRGFVRKMEREIAPKIGSVESRDFSLPRVQLKIGQGDYVDSPRKS